MIFRISLHFKKISLAAVLEWIEAEKWVNGKIRWEVLPLSQPEEVSGAGKLNKRG